MRKNEAKPFKSIERDPRKVLPRKDFFKLGLDERIYLMTYWRENYTTKHIMKEMGYNNSTALYKVIKNLGLPTDLRREKDRIAQERLRELEALKPSVRKIVESVGKDVIEPTQETKVEVNELIKENTQPTETENLIIQEEVEQQLTTELEGGGEQVTTSNLDNLPKINIELKGEISLAEVQKVIEFAQQMGLTLEVNH